MQRIVFLLQYPWNPVLTEKMALILQAAMEWIPDPLFEHRRQIVNTDKG
jgi:hypothetical protein